MRRVVRIGTRGSKLALAQAREIQTCLSRRHPRVTFKLVILKTAGDEFQSVELFRRNKTGVFTKAIEEKLLRKEIDLAVHSLK
ncbi:MAG: hydroxymethylbilane synthase, partial [Candidatus Omnitrophota bacterium]